MHRKHLCWSLFLKKLQNFRPATLLLQTVRAATLLKRDSCFLVKIAKFLILHTTNFEKHLQATAF